MILNIKSKIFHVKNIDKIPISKPKSKPTPKSRPEPMVLDVKLRKRFMNKIEHNENNIHNEIFREYFGCQNPSFLVKIFILI